MLVDLKSKIQYEIEKWKTLEEVKNNTEVKEKNRLLLVVGFQ